MLYDFRVGTPDALGTRADLLAALAAKPYQRIDGSVVPTAIWDAAVPRRFDTRGRQKISSTVSLVPPVESLKTIPLAGLYDYHDEWVGPFLLAGGPGPASPAAAIRTFVESELAKWPQFKPDHPLPIHKRLDFPTLSGFVQGFNWQRSPGAPDAHGREGWQGSRHMYMCGVPIVDPGNTRNELVHDYLSANGAIRHMALSNNPNLFARVFTS